MAKEKITIKTSIQAPVEKVWECWTDPKHIIQWNSASEDWHTPKAENDLRVGGRFSSRMEAKDGSTGFDFGGTYDIIRPNELISYTLDDDRKVTVAFSSKGKETKINETFEAENENPIDMQRIGWQAILDNFKTYTESKN
jgi:uncharacterized protein YndB with AHSA1/START domain